jgi:hypothetical protein
MRSRGVAGAVLVAVLAAVGASCKKSDEPAAASAQAPPRSFKEGLPAFKAGAQVSPAVTLVVDKGTPYAGLRALLLAFRAAREQGRLGELIPPTTPKGSLGPYAIVNVYVMDDPTWADEEHLRKAVSANVDDDFDWSFDRHTLATYVLSQGAGLSELGGLGPNNGGKRWEKLFSTGL